MRNCKVKLISSKQKEGFFFKYLDLHFPEIEIKKEVRELNDNKIGYISMSAVSQRDS